MGLVGWGSTLKGQGFWQSYAMVCFKKGGSGCENMVETKFNSKGMARLG